MENPYYQFFCGEEFFQHRLVLDRSSLIRWRQRMGEERLQALLQESLSVAVKTKAIKPSDLKRELRRRSAVEPVIGHLKSEHRMGRNYLWYHQGDAINAVLAAAGYNFRRLIQWLRLLLPQFLAAFCVRLQLTPA